jgi:hypothetical protein
MTTLDRAIQTEAGAFAERIIRTLCGASLEELLAIANARSPLSTPLARVGAGGRLRRRSSDEISQVLGRVCGLLEQHPDGLTAEAIKMSLDLERRELPKPLAEGVRARLLEKTGNKRATIYTLAARKAPRSKHGRDRA